MIKVTHKIRGERYDGYPLDRNQIIQSLLKPPIQRQRDLNNTHTVILHITPESRDSIDDINDQFGPNEIMINYNNWQPHPYISVHSTTTDEKLFEVIELAAAVDYAIQKAKAKELI